MGGRIRALSVFIVLLLVGAFLGSALSQGRARVPGTRTPRTDAGVVQPTVEERVRVEVLNGGGKPGVARDATDALRDHGFDVVYFGNASSFDQPSEVIDRVGRIELARAVADALGIRAVRSEPAANLYLDVTVVLGGEWQRPEPPPPPPAADTTRATRARWWDPRWLLERWPWKADQPAGPLPGSGPMADPAEDEEG